MKRVILLMSVAVLFFVSSTCAQVEQGSFRINPGLTYMFKPFGDSDASRMGFGVGLEYFFFDKISLSPSYHLSKKDGLRLNSLNIDARYYLTSHTLQVYGIISYQNIYNRLDVEGPSKSSTYGGVAFGAGTILGLSDKIGINPELKYSLVKAEDDAFGLLANLGVVLTF